MLPSWQFFVCSPGSSCCAQGSLWLQSSGLLCCGAEAAHCGRVPCCGAHAQEPQLADSRAGSGVWHTGPAVLWLVKSSHTRNRTCVLPISRPTPAHCTTRDVETESEPGLCWPHSELLGSSKDFFQISLKDVILDTDNLTIQRGLSQHHV